MVLPGPLPVGVDLGLVVVGEVRTGELDGGGDDGMGGGLEMRDSGGDVRLPLLLVGPPLENTVV